MPFIEVVRFFFNQVKPIIWLKVLLNFIIYFSIIISEILFLSCFYLILNNQSDSEIINNFFQKVELIIFKFINNISITETYIVALIFLLLLKNILGILQIIFYNNFIFKLSLNKSASVLKSYLNKSYQEFSKKNGSIYIKQLVRDVDNVFVGIFGLLITFINELFYILILLYFIINLINFQLSIEIFFIIFLMILVLGGLYVLAKKYGELRGVTEAAVFKTLADTLNIFKEIKFSESSANFISRYINYGNKYYRTRIASGVINITPKFFFEFFLLVLFFIIYKNESSELSLSDFILKYSVVVIAMLRLIPSFTKLSSHTSAILYNFSSIDFIKKDLLKSSYSQKKFSKKIKLNKIELINTSVKYMNKISLKNNSKLKKINLVLNKNNIYGVYGESGSGKTSLLNLLSGFIKPDEGKILFNGKTYKSNDFVKIFKIGYSTQTPTIIDENIVTNITLNYQNSTSIVNNLKKYLLLFELKKFVSKKYFDKKIPSTIKNMSGGERQRISFLRSVINNPDLILLDEPTSSLDKKNEKKIFDFLNSIKKDKIIVVTTHNTNHKKYFNKIINLQ